MLRQSCGRCGFADRLIYHRTHTTAFYTQLHTDFGYVVARLGAALFSTSELYPDTVDEVYEEDDMRGFFDDEPEPGLGLAA